ncbi:MAG: site-specific integrase [Mesorhizobium sp.]|nr:MAG: site-specific integrase [Mesorhizobium sp.]
MPKITMTDRWIASAKSGPDGRTDYFDSHATGLCLRVSESHKAWNFCFTIDGKRARMVLGSYPATSLADARGLAGEMRGYVEEGRDPRKVVDERKAEEKAAVMTVADLIESYLEKHVRVNMRSAAEVERRLRRNVIPIIGNVPLTDLHKRDVGRVVDPIVKRKKLTESVRVFEDMRGVFRWAVGQSGDLEHSPMEAMKKPVKLKPRERVLDDDEIRILWNGLPKALPRSKAVQRIIRLCLATGARVGELAELPIAELDFKTRIWNLPSDRAKNGHSHQIPLSDLAISILKDAIEAAGKKAVYVFPAEDGPLSGAAVARTILRANEITEDKPRGRFGVEHWTAHDLRRTCASKMSEIGIDHFIIGHVLNHVSTTKATVTTRTYIKRSYEAEKRRSLELWADRLEGLVAGNVSAVIAIGAGKN